MSAPDKSEHETCSPEESNTSNSLLSKFLLIKSDLDLSKHIVSISDADKADGGDGAIIIKIKKL